MIKGLNPTLLRGDNRLLSELATLLGRYDHCVATKDNKSAQNYASQITDLLRGRPAPKNEADVLMTKFLS